MVTVKTVSDGGVEPGEDNDDGGSVASVIRQCSHPLLWIEKVKPRISSPGSRPRDDWVRPSKIRFRSGVHEVLVRTP